MFLGIKPFTARRARFHKKTRFGSLGTYLIYLLLLHYQNNIILYLKQLRWMIDKSVNKII